MKTRARTQDPPGKGGPDEEQSSKTTQGKAVKALQLPPAASSKRSGSKELENLLGHMMSDEELVNVMADTVRMNWERLEQPNIRRSGLRRSPSKTQPFQLAPVEDKQEKHASDDDGPTEARKKLKFTSVRSIKDTEDKVPKTGRRAAQIRMKIAELSHKSPVAVNDLRGLTKLFYNSMAMATEEGVVAPKKGNEERVVVSSACPTPGHDGSQPVATSGVDNEDNATREPHNRRSSLRHSPSKAQPFQLAPVEDKQGRRASDDDGPSEARKKPKFTSVKSINDTEVKVPKTGRKAAQMRIKLAELSHKSEVAVNDLHRVTKLVEADMSMGVVAPRKGNEGRAASSVEPSPQCQGGDSSQPVATSSVDKLGRSGVSATKEDPELGRLVWAKLSRLSWWPGMVVRGVYCGLKPARPGYRWIFWFGDHKVSELAVTIPDKGGGQINYGVQGTQELESTDIAREETSYIGTVLDYANGIFKRATATEEFKGLTIPKERIDEFCGSFQKHLLGSCSKLFRGSVVEALRECIDRVRTNVGCHGDLDEETCLHWAKSGFLVNGESSESHMKPSPDHPVPESAMRCLRKIKEQNDRIADDNDDDSAIDVAPTRIEMHCDNLVGKLEFVRQGLLNIEHVCIACGEDKSVVAPHPLFQGGLCQSCKESLIETFFIFGDDGTNVFCVICGNGGELFVCEQTGCNRVYCTGCIAELTGGSESVDAVKHMSPWVCYMCVDEPHPDSLLVKKVDWQSNLIALFQPATIQQTPLASDFDGHPIRVLSLFDGIASGKVALDELRFDIGSYYSSEIDNDALLVTSVQHVQQIKQLGDITKLGVAEISALGPIDLLIGGSPCNDLSMVNPARKGLEGGTGLLFFEFHRILNLLLKLQPNCHLFWLFENVVFMSKEVKTTISRFLECEPAMWNAKYFSAQNRARYFWGNIPGMYCRPELSPRPLPAVDLDSTLMGDRTATVHKVRTVTTRTNSLMQGRKDDYFPVSMGSTGDTLWIPELERLFGFPDHYTDIGNIPPTRRQKLIGKAWSVPLIKYLLAPLRSFYETIPDGPKVARQTEVTHL